MALELVTNAAAAVGGLVTGVLNYFTDMFLTPPLKATLNHLEETELKTLKGGKSQAWCCVERICCLVGIRSAFSLLLNSFTLLPPLLTQKQGS